ncbi:MAG: Na+/H+ antiporter NhaC family protein [Akkermansia sp.]|nr:Na+/H+ antiporter NhaC family protein [Akkermansia sp.]
MELPVKNHRRGLWTLSPLLVFFLLYVITSVVAGDFYKMPVTVAFVAASAWAFVVCKPASLNKRIERFSAGAAHRNIMIMIWIFILAGAFAGSATFIGSVGATVNLTLAVLPSGMLLPGLFIAACLISLAIGTSVGTIVALMPVAAGIASGTGISPALMAGIVVGGAFFGDNLSFISDTTIAATRTQGCRMCDKFHANFMIVLPAAISVLIVYVILGLQYSSVVCTEPIAWVEVLPYLLVLVTALCGMNVVLVLLLGIISTGLVCLFSSSLTMLDWASSLGKGMTGMGELIIVTLLAGGMLELIRYNGGLRYIIKHLTARVHSRRGAELAIALMVSIANFCTANNTVAIVSVGDIARRVAERFGIPAQRAASLLDTFSCVVQGILPYGAQLLMGASLAGLAALDIIPYLFYTFALVLSSLLFIIFRRK